MFEDSTFECTGSVKTRSRRWMGAALGVNGTILVTLVLVPLIYPDALPRHMISALLVAPEAPMPQPAPQPVRVQPARSKNFPEFDQGRITAPGRIPRVPLAPSAPELPFRPDNLADLFVHEENAACEDQLISELWTQSNRVCEPWSLLSVNDV